MAAFSVQTDEPASAPIDVLHGPIHGWMLPCAARADPAGYPVLSRPI